MGKVYPERWPAVAEITTKAGQTHAARIDFPRGDPKTPMTREELEAKFNNLATPALDVEQRRRTIDACLHLDRVENLASFFGDLA